MNLAPRFRAAQASDAADLAALIDSASRGLLNWYWSTLCMPGESAFERGRNRIRNNSDSPSHYKRWTVAEIEGEVVGAFTGYLVSDPYSADDVAELPDIYEPMLELEAIAVGTWYLMSISVIGEYRRRGLGSKLLDLAEAQARLSGASRMSIVVESANADAHRLYRARGFEEHARRAYLPFPGSKDSGDWILLMRKIAS